MSPMRRFALAFYLTALVGLSWAPAVKATDEDTPPVFRDVKTGLEFNDFKDLKRSDVDRYDKPGLGYNVTYESAQDMRITIYVYDLNLADIPDGAFSEVVKQQLEQAKTDILHARDEGRYQAAAEVLEDIVVLGDSDSAPLMRRARFTLRSDDRNWISYVYLTGYKGHFVKIRCTFPVVHEAASEKLFATVLTRLGTMLSAKAP